MKRTFNSLLESARYVNNEDERRSCVVRLIRCPASEIMEDLIQLSQSRLTSDRDLAVWVMGELGYPRRPCLKQRIQILSDRAANDPVNKVRARSIVSLQRLRTSRTDKIVLKYSKDRSAIVREHVAIAISSGMIVSPVKTMIELSRDRFSSVREWAVFGLGNQSHACGAHRVVKALRQRVNDPDEDVRVEAMWALMNQRDFRSVSCIREYLEKRGIDGRIVEALEVLQHACEETAR